MEGSEFGSFDLEEVLDEEVCVLNFFRLVGVGL